MVEEIVHDEPVGKGATSNVRGLTGRSQPQPIGEVGGDAEDRIPLPIAEFPRACWAVALCPVRLCWWAATPASASPR